MMIQLRPITKLPLSMHRRETKRSPFFRRCSCRFSSKASLEAASSESSPVVESLPMGNIVRHGEGDAVIALNVGGKEFKTLRSTAASNPVLAEHVARAEANHELTSGGNAVFIDREPAQFGVILQYLRNRIDDVAYSSSYSYKKKLIGGFKSEPKVYAEQWVQLPKDTKVLRDLYVEACHYRMTDLQAALCRQTFLTNAAATIGIGGNPFDAAKDFMKFGRRALITVGGVGTMMLGAQQGGKEDEKSLDMRNLVDTTKQLLMDTNNSGSDSKKE